MSPYAVAGVVVAGVGVIAIAGYRLLVRGEEATESHRRLVRTAQREAERQEQDQHPVERQSWIPYMRRGRTAPGASSQALWKEVSPDGAE